MLATKLQNFSFTREELIQLDISIRKKVPFGFEVYEETVYDIEKEFPWGTVSEENRQFCLAFNDKFDTKMEPTVYNYEWFERKCRQIDMNISRAINSVGTLGGGK